ncbi:hypothetical protein Busp01_03380 [Trinickia caryophylli]|uniref:Uncharacterized protein n=1 Tax=Trinickia caryophylli TaxID=28094 RepID=A0A1X7CI24_TRICW|nr:hypothetical protein Busp01_03380 [Trinickia caryophylli]SME96727.1 hypothetical protein SAMN06295900_101389 [Trinickia caryophylli]
MAEAREACRAGLAAGAPLLRASQALGQAGWLPAQRFADALVLASPFAAGELSDRFQTALDDFHAALRRRNLRELACSGTLFAHYREFSARIAAHTGAPSVVAFEDLALAARPIAPATMRRLPAAQLARLRACYEAALLAVLREPHASGAVDELERCASELIGPDPYDVWRLVTSCAKALRLTGRAVSADAEAKRFYARSNLLLADQARGATSAPRSFVRAALALLWRDYALYGAAAEDADHVALLNDYGLTVDWHVAGTSASEVLWEAGAERAAADDGGGTRVLGVLSINVRAYEDFLQTADASMAALVAQSEHTADGEAARRASEAGYRLGAAACAVGFGHVAVLADALGLAWRLGSYALDEGAPGRMPDAKAVEAGSEALRAMLLRVAAGVAPPESAKPLVDLTRAIERAAPAYPAPPV